MLEVTEQRPMNNEYANSCISKLSPVTLIMGKHTGHFQSGNFINFCRFFSVIKGCSLAVTFPLYWSQ